jgi:hypothetical protein
MRPGARMTAIPAVSLGGNTRTLAKSWSMQDALVFCSMQFLVAHRVGIEPASLKYPLRFAAKVLIEFELVGHGRVSMGIETKRSRAISAP